MSNTFERPKLNLRKTKSEWAWDIVGYAFYIGSILFLIINWSKVPDSVPAHYNALGEVDRWGSKYELFILPIIGALTGVLLQLFEKYPHMHNYPQRLNENNAEQFYLLSRKMVNQMKNICLVVFSVILIESVSIALQLNDGLGAWFLPVMICLIFIPIVIGIMQQRKIQ